MVRAKMSALGVLVILAGALAALILMHGCGGGGDGVSASTAASTGTLQLSITDKQSDAFDKVIISVREIRVVPAGRENAPDNDPGLPVIARFTPSRVIDVMQLQFVQEALGEAVLPAGTYSQIRLVLDPAPANYLTLKADPVTQIPLTTPSGQQSGVKVLGTVEVRAGIINAVMIDFDPNTAIVARGNGDYNLKPTGIRVVRLSDPLTQFGSISGNVISTFMPWSSATVSVKRRGSTNDNDPIAAGLIFSNYTGGAWQAPFAAFVPPNTLPVTYKAFVTANGFQVYSSSTVSVVIGQATDLGAIPLIPRP
ncbi:DUF4382 domain-containing protein [Geobacter sulfurreducens]|uniref:DUF4382 domain-containing protein n=1 Tax=Geobacter sulfurreducens TaxID=35554 RepID=UPI000DBB92E4|nr:DUF4382 domain-containing protein [Geobacter sulfurreducens]BBA70065.1 hypothetical protein YM18_1530 [Geobacter sulfurreducens]